MVETNNISFADGKGLADANNQPMLTLETREDNVNWINIGYEAPNADYMKVFEAKGQAHPTLNGIGIGVRPYGTANFHILNGDIRLREDGAGIVDNWRNELLQFTGSSTALNFFRLKNSGTGQPIELNAEGDSAHIGIEINSKGGGHVRLNKAIVGDNAAGKGDGTLNVENGYYANGDQGATGTFTSADGKTITVKHGLVISIS